MQFHHRIPFVETLGMQLLRFGAGEAEIALELHEALFNSLNVAHGGVTMSLLDVVMAHAARSGDGAPPAGGRGVVTIEMKTSFMRPATGRLLARGSLLTRTLSMAFCEGSVYDPRDNLVAHATGTFKYIAPRHTARRAPASPNPSSSATP